MTYDIAKDGDIVAVFTLIKTTYRLGESVLGVVDLNGPKSDRKVLKVSLPATRESMITNSRFLLISSRTRSSLRI